MKGNCKYFAIFWFMGLACLTSFALYTCKILWIFCGKEEALLEKAFG
jgi:hypothetical protein